MDNINLNVQTRTTKGNSPARALRRDNKVPAVIYGPRSESRMLQIDVQLLENIRKKGSIGRSVYNLDIDGDKTAIPVMIKDLQTHPVTGEFLHVDFYEVVMDRKIRVHVPVYTKGKAVGVEMGGMLQLIRRELEVYCLPGNIPKAITVDVTDLEIGDSIHVEDIEVEDDMEILHDVNFTILTVSITKKEAEVAEEEEEEEEAETAEEEATEESGDEQNK